MQKTNRLLASAARIAKRGGLSLTFAFGDLGDLYHVYGVNSTASKLVAMLKARKRLPVA